MVFKKREKLGKYIERLIEEGFAPYRKYFSHITVATEQKENFSLKNIPFCDEPENTDTIFGVPRVQPTVLNAGVPHLKRKVLAMISCCVTQHNVGT